MQYPPPASSGEGRHRANRGRMSNKGVSIEVGYEIPMRPKTLKGSDQRTLLSYLNLDDSALQTDRRGVGTVVGAQFGEDVPDLTLDRFFADRKLRRNLFIGISFRNQAQDTHFCRSQGVIGGMFGKLHGGLRGKCLFPGMDAPDRLQEFLVQAIF